MSLQLILVLLAVFAAVGLAAGAVLSYSLALGTPEQREIRRLSQQRGNILVPLSNFPSVADLGLTWTQCLSS